jgi:hypothetical protein
MDTESRGISNYSTAPTDETLNSAASWKLTSPVRGYRGVFCAAEGVTILANEKITIGDTVITGFDENDKFHGRACYWVCQLLAIRSENNQKIVRLRYFEHPHIFCELPHVSPSIGFSKYEFIETDLIFEAPIGIILKTVIWLPEPVEQVSRRSRYPDYISTNYRIVNYQTILDRRKKIKKNAMRRKLWVPLLPSKPTDRTRDLIVQPEYQASFIYMGQKVPKFQNPEKTDCATILHKFEVLFKKYETIPDDISRLDCEIKLLNDKVLKHIDDLKN